MTTLNGNLYCMYVSSVDMCSRCFFCKQKKAGFSDIESSVKLCSDLSTGKNVTIGTEKIKAFLCLPSHLFHTLYTPRCISLQIRFHQMSTVTCDIEAYYLTSYYTEISESGSCCSDGVLIQDQLKFTFTAIFFFHRCI